MKNIKYLLFLIVTLFITTMSVNAATVTSATYDGKIKVEGTGDGQIQVVLFNSENEPLYMTTTNAENDKFSITLPEIKGLTNGDYKVKVADYDGTNVTSKTLTVNIKKDNPKTVDSIMNYAICTTLSLIAFTAIGLYIKKNTCND